MAAGCGGGSLDASTTPVPDGARVAPQRYLADTSAAAAAVSDFSAVLAEVAPTASRQMLLSVAPRLDAAYARTSAIADRLGAERLEDRRLEAQRARAAAALDDVIVAMRLVSDAAGAGQPARIATYADQYARSVTALRSLSARS